VNLSNEPFTIERGERIAQMVVSRHERVEWEETDSLDQTQRGEGGFGSTGVKIVSKWTFTRNSLAAAECPLTAAR